MMSPSSNRFRPFEARHKSPHKSSLCASRGPRAIGRDESPSIKGMQSELEAGARGRAGSEQGTVPECRWGEPADSDSSRWGGAARGHPRKVPPEESGEARAEHCLGEPFRGQAGGRDIILRTGGAGESRCGREAPSSRPGPAPLQRPLPTCISSRPMGLSSGPFLAASS